MTQGRPLLRRTLPGMEVFTIREAAELCGVTYEAMRTRVDRGSVRVSKRRADGARVIPKSELERLELLPGSDVAALTKEVNELRETIKAQRLLTERAESEAAAEQRARELAEQTVHQERAEKQSLALQLDELEQQQSATSMQLERLGQAGFFERRRLLRELRQQQTA
jgi:hypothetical protein